MFDLQAMHDLYCETVFRVLCPKSKRYRGKKKSNEIPLHFHHLTQTSHCINKVWNVVRASMFCSVHRGFPFALEVCQLVTVFDVGVCGHPFSAARLKHRYDFRVRFDTFSLFGFSFWLSLNELKICSPALRLFFFYIKKHCPWNLKTWGLLERLKLLFAWVEESQKFSLRYTFVERWDSSWYCRKMRLFLIVWNLFQSRFYKHCICFNWAELVNFFFPRTHPWAWLFSLAWFLPKCSFSLDLRGT